MVGVEGKSLWWPLQHVALASGQEGQYLRADVGPAVLIVPGGLLSFCLSFLVYKMS